MKEPKPALSCGPRRSGQLLGSSRLDLRAAEDQRLALALQHQAITLGRVQLAQLTLLVSVGHGEQRAADRERSGHRQWLLTLHLHTQRGVLLFVEVQLA